MSDLKPPPPMAPREYPGLLMARASAGAVQLRPGEPDENAADLLNAASLTVLWLEMRRDRHVKCSFLTYDEAAQAVLCSCGDPLFEIGDPLPESAEAVAS